MKISPRLVVFAVVICVIAFVAWHITATKPLKTDALESILSGAFNKFGLTDDTVVDRVIVEKKLGRTTYFCTNAEYNVPRAFARESFEAALKSALKNTPFRVVKALQQSRKNYDFYYFTINRGDLTVMELKINRAKPVALPPVTKESKHPKIAIVVDDFGYNMNNVDAFLDVKLPMTFSILPNKPYSKRIAELAKANGYEVILHLPLESWRNDVKEESVTIHAGMSESEIDARLKKEIADVPGIDGVSNHQGSKSTENKALMAAIFRCLNKRKLFFFDSLTSPRSVCREVAAELGTRYARRDIFIDHVNDTASIEKQFVLLRKMAFARGKAIAICHDRKTTIAVLARVMPGMAKEGIEFVKLSDLVK